MGGKTITGALVGAVILYVFGFLWYGMSGIGESSFSSLPNEETVVNTLTGAGLTSGTYIYPRMERNGEPISMDDWTALHAKGPLFEVRYHADGVEPMSATMFISGFVHFLVSTLLAAWLLSVALPRLESYAKRVMFLTMLGIFAGVFVQLSGPIWFYYPWDRALSDLAYDGLAWLVAGLGMAAIIKPRPAMAGTPVERRAAVPA
jgi:hypothetical protein